VSAFWIAFCWALLTEGVAGTAAGNPGEEKRSLTV